MRALALLLAALASAPVAATAQQLAYAEPGAVSGTVVAVRPIRPREIIAPGDVRLKDGETPGTLAALEEAVGMEARVTLYAGLPVKPGDVGAPALVERNGLVKLGFAQGGLHIMTEGRALGRAGLGERVRVMNLDSRLTVTGVVTGPNAVEVK